MKSYRFFASIIFLLLSQFVSASDCLAIKVTKPIAVVNNKADVDFTQVKLLHKDKSGICLPTQDTYILSYDENKVPFLAARIQGHTPSITFVNKNGVDYALVKYHSGNKLLVLKGFVYKHSSLEAIGDFTLTSNISRIEVNDTDITVYSSERHEDDVTRTSTTFGFDISGTFIK